MPARTSSTAAPLPRVLIVDDSAVARVVIARIVDESPRFVVAEVAGSPRAALDYLERHPLPVDYILLDLTAPATDGLAVLPDLLAAGRGARVVVVSAANDAATRRRALALGASDIIAKPPTGNMSRDFARDVTDCLARLQDGALSAPMPSRPHSSPDAMSARFDVVVIGASTGGIHALKIVLRDLPPRFDQPILITQHLPAAFMPYFAAQVATIAGRPCEIATDWMRLRPGQIVVAPGDAHVRCVSAGEGLGAIRLTRERVPSGCLPSVDPMFESAAEAFGSRTLAIVLSGMGRDGSAGARRVHDAGGFVVIQDEASSVVWGMPGSIAALGIADAVLPPPAISRLMLRRTRA